ncbi:MAG: GNAT family N-acetyltransferase, partial [Candidatus Aminicenantes bacterium]|nr:GNAT family N-acetyltransferase [Candidatus Aminicenantes bacterium]
SSASDCVFLTFEWFKSWWKNLSEEYALEVLVFQDEGQDLYGIAPFKRQGNSLFSMACREVTDYCDFVFPREQESKYFDELFQFLKTELTEISKLELINIPASSPTLKYLQQTAEGLGWRGRLEESEETPRLLLSASYDEYLAGLKRKFRHELRRKLRKVASLPELREAKYVTPEEIKSRIVDFITLHQKSSPEKQRFWEKPGMESFFRDVTLAFARKGWLELRFLYSQEQALAALLSFVYGDIVAFYNMAFNQDFATYSPGYYLFDRNLKDAISDKKIEADFLRGSEKYKYEFGAQKSKIYNLILERGVNPE